MNYYPNNFYSNYNNTFPQQMSYPNPNNNYLSGKVVDGIEVVKASEVPFGGYGVFPKADFDEVYVKTWNNNGTTKIVTYKPEVSQEGEGVDINALLIEKIQKLEEKIDNLAEQYKSINVSNEPAVEKVVAAETKGKGLNF